MSVLAHFSFFVGFLSLGFGLVLVHIGARSVRAIGQTFWTEMLEPTGAEQGNRELWENAMNDPLGYSEVSQKIGLTALIAFVVSWAIFTWILGA